MGGQRYYNSKGGFMQYNYHRVGEKFKYNGLTAEQVANINPNDYSKGLPLYTNTSDIYVLYDKSYNAIGQARVYDKKRGAMIDFDWNKPHKCFPKGTVHVHEFEYVNGIPRRKEIEPRLMTEKEIKKYGPILLHFNPNIKFR